MPPRLNMATTVTRITRARAKASVSTTPEVAAVITVASVKDETPAPKRRKIVKTDESTPETPKTKTAKAPRTPRTPKAKPEPTPAAPRGPRTPPPPFALSHAISHLSSVDARFGPLFDRIACKPFVSVDPRHIDPFRTLVTSIIGQQVSWMAARSITKRFVAFFCGDAEMERYEEGVFPTREQVANAQVTDLRGVGFSNRKAEYGEIQPSGLADTVIELAQRFVDGRLTDDLLLNGSDEEVAESLIAVRGIGRWTVDMFLIFTLRRPDVLPVGDLGVQKGLLRWVLAAHGALPPSTPRTPKKGKVSHTPSDYGATPSQPQLPATPSTPSKQLTPAASLELPASQRTDATEIDSLPNDDAYVLVTPSKPSASTAQVVPPTPSTTLQPSFAPSIPDSILSTPDGWDHDCAHRAAPLPDGCDLALLKSRLAGKKAK